METIEIFTRCPECREYTTHTVQKIRYNAWKDGMLVQRAFPDMPAEEREQLITGICPACWDKMFKDIDEDDDIRDGNYRDDSFKD